MNPIHAPETTRSDPHTTQRRTLCALLFLIELYQPLSRADRRRFFRRMRHELRPRGIVIAQCHGMCLVLSDLGRDAFDVRHDVVNWLCDQTEPKVVHVPWPTRVADFMASHLTLTDEDGEELAPSIQALARRGIRRLLLGGLTQLAMQCQRRERRLIAGKH